MLIASHGAANLYAQGNAFPTSTGLGTTGYAGIGCYTLPSVLRPMHINSYPPSVTGSLIQESTIRLGFGKEDPQSAGSPGIELSYGHLLLTTPYETTNRVTYSALAKTYPNNNSSDTHGDMVPSASTKAMNLILSTRNESGNIILSTSESNTGEDNAHIVVNPTGQVFLGRALCTNLVSNSWGFMNPYDVTVASSLCVGNPGIDVQNSCTDGKAGSITLLGNGTQNFVGVRNDSGLLRFGNGSITSPIDYASIEPNNGNTAVGYNVSLSSPPGTIYAQFLVSQKYWTGDDAWRTAPNVLHLERNNNSGTSFNLISAGNGSAETFVVKGDGTIKSTTLISGSSSHAVYANSSGELTISTADVLDGAWLTAGNSSTTSSSFIGTTSSNNNPLIFKTHGVERMQVEADGQVRTGEAVPATTTDHADYLLSVDGKIVCKELVVLNADEWADYVFDKDYKLPRLEAVASYIYKNKHLPDIPTTKEVSANGLNIAAINAKLLKKIEELTLYVIDLKNEIDKIKVKTKSVHRKNT
jgi:hypothetical protein